MVASHDHFLIVLSVVVSIAAAYSAGALSERIRGTRDRAWIAWLAGGAFANGICTCSMHYTAMAAMRLPVPVEYHVPTVLLSVGVSALGSGMALLILARGKIGRFEVLAAGILMGGVGISCMHFLGMAAMRFQGTTRYSPELVLLSVVLAMVFSWMALALAFEAPDHTLDRGLRYHASAVLRGAANPVMHFVAMAAVTFVPLDQLPDMSYAVPISYIGLLAISVVPAMVLVVVLLTLLADRLRKETALLDELSGRLRLQIDRLPLAYILLDAEHRVRDWNPAAEKMFGYAKAEALGKVCFELIGAHPRDHVNNVIRHVEAGDMHADSINKNRTKDGRVVTCAWFNTPLMEAEAKFSGVISLAHDVTERVLADQALRDSTVRLQTLSHRLLDIQEAERRHLARELHDEVGQLLTGLRLLLKPNGDAPSEPGKSRWEQAQAIVDKLLEKVRGLSFDLRPAVLDQLGLLPALLELFENYTKNTAVLVHFKYKDLDRRFDLEVETTAYRIVQEALTNVARHAGVGGVTVRVWAAQDMLSVQIEDHGHGFDLDLVQANSRLSGLAGMRERVMLLDGQLTIDSRPGEGTHISADLPLGRPTAENTGEGKR